MVEKCRLNEIEILLRILNRNENDVTAIYRDEFTTMINLRILQSNNILFSLSKQFFTMPVYSYDVTLSRKEKQKK